MVQQRNADDIENQTYYSEKLDKEEILKKLRSKGCRITKQRETLIDVILHEDCTCCKEIYYLAIKKMPDIGIATIYRMVSVLEEVGALKREMPYRLGNIADETEINECVVKLENGMIVKLSKERLCKVVEQGLKISGRIKSEAVKSIVIK